MILISFFLVLFRIRGRVKLSKIISHEKVKIRELKPLTLSYLTLLPFTIVLGIYMAIIPGHMKTVGLSASIIGLLLSLTNGIRGIAFFNVERFVKWSVMRSLFVASIMLSLAMFLVRGRDEPLGFLIPLAFYGFGSGIMTPVVLDFISKRTPQRLRGTAMGVHEGVYGVGMCFGPLIGGAIADIYSPSILYSILIGVSLVVLPLSYLMIRNDEQ